MSARELMRREETAVAILLTFLLAILAFDLLALRFGARPWYDDRPTAWW